MSMLVLKLALALGAVIGLILLLQRASRRWGKVFGAGAGAEKIRLVSQRSLGPRTSLALVQVMNRSLLLGVSPQGVRTVADLGPVESLPAGSLPAGSLPAESPRAEAASEPLPAAIPNFETELARRLSALQQRFAAASEAPGDLPQEDASDRRTGVVRVRGDAA